MTVIGFGTYALAAHWAGAAALATLSAVLAASTAAFLISNFHPARIFMGDVGSVPLGFLCGALGIVGWRDDVWPLWFPMLVFAPFMCDATLTLVKRLLRGEKVSHAHREHYYQRLVRMGFGHRGTAYIEYAAMLGCALTALAARTQRPAAQLGAVAASAAVMIAIAVWVDLRWARHVKAAP
jgi:UDP-N-acetylmuramyl pentapeptide phosphotransferase/UDP-N-acetylglucosamine-1-phosphate transferase